MNLTQPITEIDGTEIREGEKPVTVRTMIVRGLLSPDQNASPEDKYKRFKLAMRVEAGEGLEAEDIVTIKECVGGAFAHPLIVGRVFDALKLSKE